MRTSFELERLRERLIKANKVAQAMNLKLCDALFCERATTAMFCCGQCEFAWNAKPRFEPTHAESCNTRHEERLGAAQEGEK